MKLNVDIGSIGNVFPVVRRSYLLHDVGDVGVVSGVESVFDVLCIRFRKFPYFLHWLAELLSYPELSGCFVKWSKKESIKHFMIF